jgi:hypothetical protein
MVADILFGKRKAYKVESRGYSRTISGRYYKMSYDGFLNIYDAWWAKVATIRDVQSIIEVEV